MKHYGCPTTFGARSACVILGYSARLRCDARLDLELGLGLAVPCDKKGVLRVELWTLANIVSLSKSQMVTMPTHEHVITQLPCTHRVCVFELAILECGSLATPMHGVPVLQQGISGL